MYIAIFAGVMSGLFNLVSKKIVSTKFDPKSYNLMWVMFATVFFFPFAIFDSINTNLTYDVKGICILFLAGLFFSFANRGIYSAFQHNSDLSKAGLISNANIIIISIISLILFNEQLNVYKILAIIFIFIGCSVAFAKKNIKFDLTIGDKYLISSMLFGSFAVILNKFVLGNVSLSLVFLLNYLMQIPFVISKKTISESISIIKEYKFLFVFGCILIPLSWGSYTYALKLYEASYVQPLYQAISLLSQIILGIIILKEIENIPNKIIGFCFNIVGIILIYFAG